MKKLFSAFLLLLLLCGCQHKEEKVAAKVRAVTDSTLRVALLPTMDCLPFYYADKAGIFDSLGLDVRLRTYRSAMDADTAFLGVSAEMIVSDMVKATLWKERGDSVKCVMSGDLNLFLITAQNARLSKITSLKDKIVGITRHSSDDLFADEILRAAKLNSMDLNKPQINNIRLRCLMVDQNEYDGAVLPEPFASESEARGGKRVISSDELKLPNLSAVLMRDSVAKKFKGQLVKFVEGYNISVEALNSLIGDSVYPNMNAPALMKYLPVKLAVDVPDTLVAYRKFKKGVPYPNDSAAVRVAKEWCKGRELVK